MQALAIAMHAKNVASGNQLDIISIIGVETTRVEVAARTPVSVLIPAVSFRIQHVIVRIVDDSPLSCQRGGVRCFEVSADEYGSHGADSRAVGWRRVSS